MIQGVTVRSYWGQGWWVGYVSRVVGGEGLKGGGWGRTYGWWEGKVVRVVGGVCNGGGWVFRVWGRWKGREELIISTYIKSRFL